MPKVTFITEDQSEHVVEDAEGTLMEAAVDNDIESIEGDCGGVCSCATCHVKIPEAWRERVGPTNEAEQDTMGFMDNVDASSRLSCQIELTDALDGLVVHVPAKV